ncbi:hypothetical protein AAC387_Pa06g2181 [Persea americana]
MESLIPLVYKAIKENNTCRKYKCLSKGPRQSFHVAEFDTHISSHPYLTPPEKVHEGHMDHWQCKSAITGSLAEKIIQDRYCDSRPVQLKLYEQFSGSNAREEISSLINVDGIPNAGEGASSSPKASAHVFQALQYLLKLCSHPLLVLGERPPDSLLSVLSELMHDSANIVSDLHELHHSPKLVTLQEILEECGIGLDTSSAEGTVGVGQHRVFIFAQHKYSVRAGGSGDEGKVVRRKETNSWKIDFSGEKPVTPLLDTINYPIHMKNLSTRVQLFPYSLAYLQSAVGGPGLNLTSADTLVFMEHDWNPTRDHQAMDEAHRLGQRKVVNVHRLIICGTLEEKVMSLQKFKVSVANDVINAETANLNTMNTDQLLDLFTSSQIGRKAMGRVHRLGKCKVVNLHRLIMRGTLEEKVMSLQKFGVLVANAVINAEYGSLNTMNTDQLLDLFTLSQTGREAFDTTKIYGSETAVGRGLTKALSEGIVNREEKFVTSKLWGSDHHAPVGGLRQTLKMSPSEFIVPFDQYMESIKANHYIGMRFKMIFEGEEAEQRCFLLTPKLLPDMEYSDACSILNIMNGSWIEKPEQVFRALERG